MISWLTHWFGTPRHTAASVYLPPLTPACLERVNLSMIEQLDWLNREILRLTALQFDELNLSRGETTKQIEVLRDRRLKLIDSQPLMLPKQEIKTVHGAVCERFPSMNDGYQQQIKKIKVVEEDDFRPDCTALFFDNQGKLLFKAGTYHKAKQRVISWDYSLTMAPDSVICFLREDDGVLCVISSGFRTIREFYESAAKAEVGEVMKILFSDRKPEEVLA